MKKLLFSSSLLILTLTATAALDVPTLSLPADSAANQMPNAFVKWNPVTNATYFKIQVDLNENFTNPKNFTSVPTGFNLSELLFGTNYHWRVKAMSQNDSSAWSSSRMFTTFYNLFTLNTPAMVNAKATFTISANADMANDMLTIAGNPITEGTHFVVGGSAAVTATNIANAINVHFVLSNIVVATTDNNKVIVTAIANGTLGNSITVSHTAGGASGGSWGGATLTGGNFGINAVSGNLSWNGITGVNFYQFEIDTTPLFDSPKNTKGIVPFGTNVGAVEQLLFDTYHYWRIRAIHSQDTSGWSAFKTFKTPASLTHVSPANQLSGAMADQKLTWSLMNGVLEFDVQYDTTANFNSTELKTIFNVFSPTNFANGIKLLFNQKYYWRVRGVHDFDTSPWSSPWEFTTINQIPLYQPANGQPTASPIPTFRWKNVTGISKYELQLDVNTNFTNPVTYNVNQGGNDSAFTVPAALVMNQTYYWRVRALHSKDTTDWSQVFNFVASNTGLAENASAMQLQVYPNPANNVLHIAGINATTSNQVHILDMLGNRVYSQSQKVLQNGALTLDVSSLPAGIYFIHVENAEMKQAKRFVINR